MVFFVPLVGQGCGNDSFSFIFLDSRNRLRCIFPQTWFSAFQHRGLLENTSDPRHASGIHPPRLPSYEISTISFGLPHRQGTAAPFWQWGHSCLATDRFRYSVYSLYKPPMKPAAATGNGGAAGAANGNLLGWIADIVGRIGNLFRCAMPCHTMPYHTMPYHTMPCHAVLRVENLFKKANTSEKVAPFL